MQALHCFYRIAYYLLPCCFFCEEPDPTHIGKRTLLLHDHGQTEATSSIQDVIGNGVSVILGMRHIKILSTLPLLHSRPYLEIVKAIYNTNGTCDATVGSNALSNDLENSRMLHRVQQKESPNKVHKCGKCRGQC